MAIKGKRIKKAVKQVAERKTIPTLTVCINLEQRSADGYKHLHDELVFNLNEESIDTVLKCIRPVLKRGDLESAFISMDRELITKEEWDSHGKARDWKFGEE